MKTQPLLTLTVLICLIGNLWGQHSKAQIEAVVTSYLSPDSPGMAIIVTEKGKVSYKKAFGLSDIATQSELTPDHQFRIGSITKQFTAAAILKLAHEQRLSLQDPIGKYIPHEAGSKEISIMQLLTHTSGLGNQSDLPSIFQENQEFQHYPQDVIEPILNSPLKFAPGTNYAYSNLGYVVLGYLIEIVSKSPYESFLNTHFFEPLEMNHTGFEYLEDFTANMSKGYSFVNNRYESAAPINMKIPYAAGGLVSTLADLAVWNKAVMQGKVLPMSYVTRLQTSHVLPNGRSTGYSMGWQIGNIQGVRSVKHDGIVNGYTSMAIYLPEKDMFVVALSNCDAYRDIELPTSQIAAVMLGTPFRLKAEDVSNKKWGSYQGIYRHQGKEMKVVLHDADLMYYAKGGDKTPLVATGENTFSIPGSLDQIEFGENEPSFTLTTLAHVENWNRTEALTAYQSLALDRAMLDEYVGKYQVPGKFVFEVTRIDDVLYGQIGNDRKEIFCFATDKFCARDTDAELQFARDEAGKVMHLTLTTGVEFSATRIR